MKHRERVTGRLLAAASILGLVFLAACAPGYPATLCHATGDPSKPYELITITGADAAVHLQHPNDFGPAPAGGCPSSPVSVTDGKITICHATNSTGNPFNEITVSANGLNGHANHPGDIIPAPEGGCPATPLTPAVGTSGAMITICHATGSQSNPYIKITVSVNGLNGHDKHQGDIIPAPAAGCPATKP